MKKKKKSPSTGCVCVCVYRCCCPTAVLLRYLINIFARLVRRLSRCFSLGSSVVSSYYVRATTELNFTTHVELNEIRWAYFICIIFKSKWTFSVYMLWILLSYCIFRSSRICQEQLTCFLVSMLFTRVSTPFFFVSIKWMWKCPSVLFRFLSLSFYISLLDDASKDFMFAHYKNRTMY